MKQQEIFTDRELQLFSKWIDDSEFKNILLVCGRNTRSALSIDTAINNCENHHKIVWFDDFSPNPTYQSVVKGVKEFRDNCCDCILAVGGGSAMDVAKCIKLYSSMHGNGKDGEFLKGVVESNEVCLAVMPTTAGTGSEATKFAVIYYDEKKQSVSNEMCIPEVVFFNPDALVNLPEYHKKSAMLDALSHAIESYWSVNSTMESRKYSRESIKLILDNMDAYLSADCINNTDMLMAANAAGKAINISQTTAGHAMCYKLTSEFGIAHGHAAFLCNMFLLPWMIDNVDKCSDSRGLSYLKEIFQEISEAFACNDIYNVSEKMKSIFTKMGMSIPRANKKQLHILCDEVNPERLKNNPIRLDKDDIYSIYLEMLGEICDED